MRSQIPDDVAYVDLHCRHVRSSIPKILRFLRKTQPDAVLVTVSHLILALAIFRFALPPRTRLVGRETTLISESIKHYPMPPLWAALFKRFYRKIDTMICQSVAMQKDLVENWNYPVAHTVVINNPIDAALVRAKGTQSISNKPPRSADADDLIRFVAAGRLAPEKGFDLLVQAIAISNNTRIRLTILGEGPLREALTAQVAGLGLQDRVHFLGHVENPFPYFADAHAFILSSRYEGFPNVVLEALACGTPVIATPAPGGTLEILRDFPECVVATAVSAEALGTAIDTWLSRSPAHVDPSPLHRYDVNAICEQYAAVLEESSAVRS